MIFKDEDTWYFSRSRNKIEVKIGKLRKMKWNVWWSVGSDGHKAHFQAGIF